MAASMAGVFASPVNRLRLCPPSKILGPPRKMATNLIRQSALGSRVLARSGGSEMDRFGSGLDEEGDCEVSVSMEDYFTQAAVLVKSTGDGGGPRWFSPVECGRPLLKGAPLLLYLPGIDGIGLGLLRQHRKLGRIFETWCLHIPLVDRTSFAELVNIVEAVIKSEHSRSTRRPIYLVGESFGGCLALAVASRNADIDLLLVLANPATSFNKSAFHLLTTTQLHLVLSLVEATLSKSFLPTRGQLVNVIESFLGQSQATKDLLHGLQSLSSYYSGMKCDVERNLQIIADIVPIKTFIWKMEMLKTACNHANSCLHGIKAQTLILTSGMDPLLPSLQEGERLRGVIPNCEIRKFYDKGHFLFLEDGADLVYTIKGATFYRRGRFHDYASDYLPPTPSEFQRFQDRYWWLTSVASPVVLSTLEDGTIVRGLAGIPSEGPTLYVGYHMLMGIELTPLFTSFLAEKNILVRGLAHPMMFKQPNEKLPDLSELMRFELMHILMGAVPVSSRNFFKLLASKSHVLLYPGGAREALHRKGEEYKLFWPEESEFVRMAARFGANIVPFGAVGEDDIGQLVLDYNDTQKIPYMKEALETLTNELVQLRTESSGEVSNQQFYVPGVLPKVPGRLYYLFGKPIQTEGRRKLLQDKKNAHELYLEVKCEVERCLAYLKEKREDDPYRSLISRLVYLSTHNNTSQIPTFKL